MEAPEAGARFGATFSAGCRGLNSAEVFSPKVKCHLVSDGMVLVGGLPRPRALSVWFVVGESSLTLASAPEEGVTEPQLRAPGLCL